MHDISLIVNFTVVLAAAFVCGAVAQRFGLSPILGYLVAGIALSPHTPGFVADVGMAQQLAEIGVILLMFGVGLHFQLRDLLAVKWIALPGAVGQSLVATVAGAALAVAAGWSLAAGVVLGLAVSVASTVVLIRVLADHGRLNTPEGHVAVGWLLVEDIFTVLILVLLPALALASGGPGGADGPILVPVVWALAKLALLVAVMLVLGAKVVPWLLMRVARTRSNELLTLCVLALALVIATGSSALFGASPALGAFLAGMVVGRSPISHQAAANALPMRDAFAVLFFASIGMLFDPGFLLAEPWLTVGILAVILLGKPAAALAIVLTLGYSVRTALTVAVGLAQVGEFSFILGAAAQELGVLPMSGYSVIVAAALISISLNPFLFRMVEPAEAWLRRHDRLWSLLNRRAERRGRNLRTLAPEPAGAAAVSAVVVGYGPVGQTVARILTDFGVRLIVIDLNIDTVSRLAAEGRPAIYGDAMREEILKAAGVDGARYLLVTLPDLLSTAPVVATARMLNPRLKIFVRARYVAERAILEEMGATAVCYEEAEAAVGLAKQLLLEVGAPGPRVDEEEARIRAELAVRPWRSIMAEAIAPDDQSGHAK